MTLRRRTTLTLLTGFFALVFVAGTALVTVRAAAVLRDVSENGAPGYLTLQSDPLSPEWVLNPGDEVHWHIRASLSDAPSGTLELELRSEGSLVTAGGLVAAVEACTLPYMGGDFGGSALGSPFACTGTATTVLLPTPLAMATPPTGSGRFPLADLQSDHPRYLLLTLTLPIDAPPEHVRNARAIIDVGLHVAGDSASVPDGALPATGVDMTAVALLGLGLLGLGATIAAWRRDSKRRAQS